MSVLILLPSERNKGQVLISPLMMAERRAAGSRDLTVTQVFLWLLPFTHSWLKCVPSHTLPSSMHTSTLVSKHTRTHIHTHSYTNLFLLKYSLQSYLPTFLGTVGFRDHTSLRIPYTLSWVKGRGAGQLPRAPAYSRNEMDHRGNKSDIFPHMTP